jgi:ubiquitin-protein ligase
MYKVRNIMNNCENIVWNGVIFIRSGPYIGGIFKFTVNFPINYPKSRPTVTFLLRPKFFHPLIDDKGTLNLEFFF